MLCMEYMTVEEVAKELRVSTDTVLRFIRRKQLVAYQVGVQYRITRDELQRFMDTRRTDKPEDTRSP